MPDTRAMTERIAAMQDFKLYRELSWEGTFVVISYGTEEYIDNKKRLIRYNFFKDEC